MSDAPHQPLPKLRTFALDQAHVRGDVPIAQKVTVVPETSTPPPKEVPSPKSPAPAAVKNPPIVVRGAVAQPPAFHELKKIHKEPTVAAKVPEKKVTVRAKQNERFATDTVIITDNKRGEFKLIPAIIASVSAWFKELTKKENVHAYKVEPVTMRKGVVQKATTKTGAAFIGTQHSIKQEILKRREVEEHDIELTWTPQTEPGFPLLESHTPATLPEKTAIVTFKQRTLPKPEIAEPTPPVSVPPPIAPAPKPVSLNQNWTERTYQPPVEPLPPRPVPPIVPREQTRPLPEPPVVPSVQNAVPTLTIPRTPNPRSSYLRNGLRSLVRFDTTLTTVVVVGSLLSFVMVFLVVQTLVGIISPEVTQEEIVETTLPKLLEASDSVVSVALSETTSIGLERALAAEPRPASSLVEFALTAANGTPLSGSELWTITGARTNPNFAKTIVSMRFLYINGEPGMVVEVTDPTTAFGALLGFESMMLEDLPDFLNVGAVTTVVSDGVIGSSDVRIFKDGTEEVLVYGFIGKNHIVITTSTKAFEAALGSSR